MMNTKYIIIDLEATCWENRSGKISEIIEIGAVCIKHGKVENEFCEFVKPVLNPQLSEFCRTLTSIKQSDVDAADTFDKVIARFRQWIDTYDNFILCSWGFYDKAQLEADCSLNKIETAWLKDHISLKHQYTKIRNLPKPIGMAAALKMEQLALEGTHHRGIDDARNIAKIFLRHSESWKIEQAE